MTSTDTLLPCPVPWCGSDVLEVVRSPWSRGYCITCQSCGVQSPSRETEAEATAAWNRRTPPTPATEEREALGATVSAFWDTKDTVESCINAVLSALAPIRAAEILAAEANERARIVALVRQHAKSQRLDGLRCVLELSANAIEHGAGK